MGSIILPSQWRQQPQQAVPIDWGNPLTQGLVFACYPTGNAFYDVISGQFAGHPGTFRARQTIDGNRADAVSAIGAAAAGGAFPNQTGLDKIAGPFTLFVEGSLEVNATTQAVVMSRETAKGDALGMRFDDVAAVNNGFIYYANNGNQANSGGGLGNNSEQFTHRVAFTADGVNALFYAKRSLINTVAKTTLPNANANRRTTMAGSDGTQNSGSIALALAWNRVLSLSEYQALYDNPWQLFKAPARRIWVASAGGGGSTPTVISLTTASMTTSAKATQNRTALALTSAIFSTSAKAIQSRLSTPLGAAVQAMQAQSITVRSSTIVQLGAAVAAFVGQAVKNTIATTLAAAAITMTAKAIRPGITNSLGAAALTMAAQAITTIRSTLINLAAATLAFSEKAITVTFAGALAAVGDWLARARRRGRR